MTETVRLWLVDRAYDDRNLITAVYATPDGDRMLTKEQSATVMHHQGSAYTAAIDASAGDLDTVDDPDERDRYAAEATRMADRHDPDDEV